MTLTWYLVVRCFITSLLFFLYCWQWMDKRYTAMCTISLIMCWFLFSYIFIIINKLFNYVMNYYLYLIYNILWWNNLEVWLLLMFLKVKGILKIKSGELIMFWKKSKYYMWNYWKYINIYLNIISFFTSWYFFIFIKNNGFFFIKNKNIFNHF